MVVDAVFYPTLHFKETIIKEIWGYMRASSKCCPPIWFNWEVRILATYENDRGSFLTYGSIVFNIYQRSSEL